MSRPGFRIAWIYLALGLLWILGSDAALLYRGALDLGAFAEQTAKGGLFVILSAIGVYLLVEFLPVREGRLPTLVALAYFALGMAWIFGSDFYLFQAGHITSDALWTQLLKGTAFVTVSAFVIFLLGQLFGGQPPPGQDGGDAGPQPMPFPDVDPLRIAGVFGMILLGLWLMLDAYYLLVNQETTPAEFYYQHAVESLLLTIFASTTLFLLLRFYIDQARAAVRRQAQSDQRYFSLFERHPDPAYLLDREGRFREANAAVGRWWQQGDAILGRNWEELAAPEHLGFARARFKAALEGESQSYEIQGRGPDGEALWFHVTNVPQYDGVNVDGVFGIARDITASKTAREQIASSEARFRALFEHSPDLVFLTRPDGSIEAANEAAQSALGLSEREIIERGREGIIRTSDPTLSRLLSERERTGHASGSLEFVRADGTTIPTEITTASFQGLDGQALAFVVARDISDRVETERQLELVDAAFRSADEAMILCDSEFTILDVNQAYTRLTGRTHDEVLGCRPRFLNIEEQESRIREGLRSEGHWRGELLQQRVDGSMFVSRAAITEAKDPHGGDAFLVINFEDISELRDYARKVDYLSYHDRLTGLPNRYALKDWFGSETQSGKPESGPRRTLILMNLDRLNIVNNAFGHEVGDQVIEELARRMRKSCDKEDYVARLIGDDFLMVLGEAADPEETLDIIRQRLKTLTAPLQLEQAAFHPTVCVGVVVSPEDGVELEDLLRKADMAMHTAKLRGRGEIVVFTSEMNDELEYRFLIEQQLRSGLEHREFLLQYQPSVCLSSQEVVGLEALVRWHSRQLGLVRPDRFISVAEDNGMIIELGGWIFDEVCRQIAEWREAGVAFGWVAVNFSPIQFQDPGLIEMLRSTMDLHGVQGKEIRVEITESVLVIDPDWTVQLLRSLQQMGIMIAVDDFGTGYSSLAYLKRFPVDLVKLDKSFVAGLPQDESDASIVSSVIHLAERLGLGIVAEGIERKDQLAFLQNAGCPEAQGYYFSRPLDVDDLTVLLNEDRMLPAGLADEPAEDDRRGD